jgi:hypothetical protein
MSVWDNNDKHMNLYRQSEICVSNMLMFENETNNKSLVWMGGSLVEKGSLEYEKRRRNNNEAVKRCRNKWIQKQNEKEQRMKELIDENENLKSLVLSLKKELNEAIHKRIKNDQEFTKIDQNDLECMEFTNEINTNQFNKVTMNNQKQESEKTFSETLNQDSSNLHLNSVPVFENASKQEEELELDLNPLSGSEFFDFNKVFDFKQKMCSTKKESSFNAKEIYQIHYFEEEGKLVRTISRTISFESIEIDQINIDFGLFSNDSADSEKNKSSSTF